MRRHFRRPRSLLLLAALLAVFGVVGWATHSVARGRFTRQGVSCVFHGWRAWEDARRHHPLWTTYQLWQTTHHCRRAWWRY